MSKGLIFDIEEFAVHDGPGVRKVVFLKGCPLRCNWCHNPEGMSFEKELMVSRASCTGCGKCKDVCKSADGGCVLCEKCINVCPHDLRKICGEWYEVKDLAKELLKGREILEESGGGITISGGEPLAQPEFLIGLINELKPIHIAVETSGHAPVELFEEIVSKVDLVLMDLKHTDTRIHKQYTGIENDIIINNLRLLCGMETKFCLRIPLIPGVNDAEENMRNTAMLIKDAKNLVRVELLPYHRTAGAKYQMLNKEYTPLFDENAKPQIPNIFREYNIRSEVL